MGIIKTNLTLIYSDSRKRDSTVALLIKAFISKNKQLGFIASRRNFSKILRLITPANVVVIGQINMIYDLIYNGKKLKREFEGMNVYFYPAEGYAMDHEYKIMYPAGYNYNDTKKIFFWGQESLQWAENNLEINREILDNTGYPRMKMASVYASLQDKIPNKIGIVGRFPMLNDLYGVLPMVYMMEEFINNTQYQAEALARLEAQGRTVPVMLRIMEYIFKQTNYTISIRPHPNEDRRSYEILKKYFGDRLEISEEVDAAEWMTGCNKIVGLATSSYVDAALLNVPIICLDKIANVVEETKKYEPALRLIYEVAYLPETFEELTTLIKSDIEIKKSEIFDTLLKTNFIGNYADPIKHVADSIQLKKTSIMTRLVKAGLDCIDYLLALRDSLRKSSSLDFEYSTAIHGRDKRFIDKYISSDK
jgi:surface carbohydrate biosynthesis protein